MKKIYLLTLALAAMTTCFEADAQWRKSWDFLNNDISDETRANLDADATNWTKEGTNDEGLTTGWKDAKKLSGELTANGVPIEELRGITFGTSGLSNSNNIIIRKNQLRLTRKNMTFNLPKLTGGQIVTIMAQSANATATDRGIKANVPELKRIEGPEDDILLGEAGLVTSVWMVDESVTDSVDIQFVMYPNGGIDIRSIIIDNGDTPDIQATPTVAYLYAANEGYDVESDLLYVNTPIYEQDAVAIDMAQILDGTVSQDSLETYSMLVYSEALADGLQNVTAEQGAIFKNLLGRVPVLNFAPSIYTTPAFACGTVVEAGPQSAWTIAEEALEHELFTDCAIDGNLFTAFIDGDAIDGDKLLGYHLDETSLLSDAEVLATIGEGVPSLSVIGRKNSYIMMGIASENILVEEELMLSEDINMLLSNTITFLANSKGEVNKATKPSISFEYKNGLTAAIIKSSAPNSRVYYTLDGSEPSMASTLYTDTLTFTESGTIINARTFVFASDASDITSDSVVVKYQLPQPSYNVTYADGVANVSFTAAEGADVYYNITGSNNIAESQLYVDSIGLTVTRPTLLTFFAASDDMLPSDPYETVIEIEGAAYWDTVVEHLDFKADEWNPGKDLVSRSNYYDWDNPSDSTIVFNEETQQNDTIRYYTTVIGERKVVPTVEGWAVASSGQRILTQKTGTSTTIGASYGPGTAFDAGASSNGLTFLQTGKGKEPATAELYSTKKFQAPFALALHFTGQGESGDGKYDGKYREAVSVQVSTDSINWTVVDTLATNYMKLMSYQILPIEGTEELYIKVKSAHELATSANQKCMIFDLWILNASGNRPATGIEEVISSEKTVKAVRMFNLAGQSIRVAEQGINIIQTIYSDGSVESKKVLVK